MNNSFTWKGINLSFLIDFRIGGDIFSGTNNRLTQWGLSEQSLQGREGEQPIHIKGVTRTGEGTEDSPYVYSEVDRDLTPHEAQNYWDNVGGETTAITTMFMYDGSFAKIRQLTLGYSLPAKVLQKTPFKSVGSRLLPETWRFSIRIFLMWILNQRIRIKRARRVWNILPCRQRAVSDLIWALGFNFKEFENEKQKIHKSSGYLPDGNYAPLNKL